MGQHPGENEAGIAFDGGEQEEGDEPVLGQELFEGHRSVMGLA